MMNKKLLYLVLSLTILFGLISSQPVLAQEGSTPGLDLDASLAQAAAKSFLVTLIRPELAATQSFYLLPGVADGDYDVLASFKTNPATSFQLTETGWLDEDTYRAIAILQPGNRNLTLYAGNYNGRWQIEDLTLAEPETNPETAPVANQPAAATQTTTSRQPAGSGLTGQLVFQTQSGGDIYLIQADGSGLRRLTHGLDPQLSPDGSQIAFTRWEPRYELFTLNLQDGTETARASGYRQMKSPAWSADGSRLIFSFQSGGRLQDEKRSIDLAQAAREGDAPDVPEEARDVEVEDGQLKYRLPMDATWYLKQFDLATGQLQDLPASQYAYSPAGHPTQASLLLYTVGGRGIAMYDTASQTSQPVTTDPNDRAPVLSPDGSKVAVSYNQDGHWEVHTFNLDGSNRQRLTQTPLTVLVERTTLQTEPVAGKERTVPPGQPHWNNAAPAWSPDGSQIAFLTDRTGKWEIWVMNADGSNQRPMFPNGELDGLTFNYAGVDERMLSWQ